MINSSLKKSLLLPGLVFICVYKAVEGATATAIVTVQVVPGASFYISERISLNVKPERQTVVKPAAENSNAILVTSLNAENPARLRLSSDENRAYGITISSSSTVANSTGSITIRNMKVASEVELSADNDEKLIVIEGEIVRPDDNNKGTFIGTTEINLNYN